MSRLRARLTGPVWLLDVDGVINAISREPNPHIWPADQWVQAQAVAGSELWPILAAQPVLDFIRSVHEQGRAEIRWHTTWQHDAMALGRRLGLPGFPVADAPEWKTWPTTPSAGWWKRPAAERVLRDEGRPLVWTDDDITFDLGRRGRDEMAALGSVLLIAADDKTGLTRRHLRLIGEFLDVHAAPPAGDGRAPRRIQLKRSAGWRLPAGAVIVDRRSRWGNPFKVGEPVPRESPLFSYLLRTMSVKTGLGPFALTVNAFASLRPQSAEVVVDAYGWWFIEQPTLMMSVREDLGGRDLACWCPLPAPGEEDVCHAAFLLAMANEEAPNADHS